jgi:hypothetical protein
MQGGAVIIHKGYYPDLGRNFWRKVITAGMRLKGLLMRFGVRIPVEKIL